jgi:hypothetical protein
VVVFGRIIKASLIRSAHLADAYHAVTVQHRISASLIGQNSTDPPIRPRALFDRVCYVNSLFVKCTGIGPFLGNSRCGKPAL